VPPAAVIVMPSLPLSLGRVFVPAVLVMAAAPLSPPGSVLGKVFPLPWVPPLVIGLLPHAATAIIAQHAQNRNCIIMSASIPRLPEPTVSRRQKKQREQGDVNLVGPQSKGSTSLSMM
jgi:hypothetical protein